MGKDKIECLVKGKILKLSPEAFKMAEEYFGAERMDALSLGKPIELSKPLLIPRKPVLSQPIELPVTKPKDLGKLSEVVAEKVVAPIVENIPVRKAPVKREVKKAKK
jgi:hypothetical protein